MSKQRLTREMYSIKKNQVKIPEIKKIISEM